MQRLLLLTIVFLGLYRSAAQKPALDTSVYGKWPSVAGAPLISPDGKYAFYTISNQPSGRYTIVLQAIGKDWKMEFSRGGPGRFSADGRLAILPLGKDSIGLIHLADGRMEWLKDVQSLQLPESGDIKGLIFQKRTLPKALFWRDLASDSTRMIWEGDSARDFVFNAGGDQLAFIAGRSSWYYRMGTPQAVRVSDLLGSDDSSFVVLTDLSADGRRLFFRVLQKEPTRQPVTNLPKVDVWSYHDPKLQSQQLAEQNVTHALAFVMTIPEGRISQLEEEGERLFSQYPLNTANDDYILVAKEGGGDVDNEWNWNKTARMVVYLVSTSDGSRKLIKDDLALPTAYSFWLSPQGKYVLFYDPHQKNYRSYEITTGLTKQITQNIKTTWTTYHRSDEPQAPYNPMGVAAWTKGDSAVLLYDQYDIIRADPAGKLPAVNLTGGYGRRHNIHFHLAISAPTLDQDRPILISAFDRISKKDGFYQVIPGRKEPQILILQPALFEGTNESDNIPVDPPVKAGRADVYLVRRMSADESPNYYVTANFKHLTPLTSIHPEKGYNWLTTDLITWKMEDGTMSQGILYKPENFNPAKRYPLIFLIYEKWTEDLHAFMYPRINGATIDIPWYVSNGYLVFTPDIHYKTGYPGRSALRTVIAAARVLAHKPWVDPKRLGIQGHSFGGYEVNYIVTHSPLFAAACSAAGWSDWISAYNSIRELGHGRSHQIAYEMYRERIGATLWEKPELYIENSPIFKTDRIKTPLLLMNNKADEDIPFTQGIEFFTALRRLGKKAWMLQYDHEGHVLLDKKAVLDYMTRESQFFDFYLKGKPVPEWMDKGASLTGFR